MPKENSKIKQSKFHVLPGFYYTWSQKEQEPPWILYSCWSFHHLSPQTSNSIIKKNTDHQQQLLTIFKKKRTSFFSKTKHHKWLRINNLELYDKHLRCPEYKHLLPCWGELFTPDITKIRVKACLDFGT